MTFCACVRACAGASSSHLGYRYICHLPHSFFPLPYPRPLLYAIPLPRFPIIYFPFAICFPPTNLPTNPHFLWASHSLIPLLRFCSSLNIYAIQWISLGLSFCDVICFSSIGVFFRFIRGDAIVPEPTQCRSARSKLSQKMTKRHDTRSRGISPVSAPLWNKNGQRRNESHLNKTP